MIARRLRYQYPDGHQLGDRKARLCVKLQLQAALTSTVALVRDVGSMAIGFYIFLHEEAHRPSDGFLLLAGVALIGGPAALQFALLLRAARGTDSPSSPPAGDSPARPSPAPSSSNS